ncbi:MAG: hypothetical protein ABI639_14475 [Thermoanaerobaculia bacterium]
METVAQLWKDLLAGTPATDNVAVLLILASAGLGGGALLLWQEARSRKAGGR